MAEIMSKNGEAVVTVTPDYHNAFVTLYPPVGVGIEITFEDVMAALAEKGVRFNIDEQTIKNANIAAATAIGVVIITIPRLVLFLIHLSVSATA